MEYDELMELIKRRRSTRWYDDREVTYDDACDIVKAGIYAPSAANSQNQRFMIIKSREEIERIGSMRYSFPYPSGYDKHPYGIIGNASVLIVVLIDKEAHPCSVSEAPIWHEMWLQNGAASIQNMLLAAEAKGIKSCWISASDRMNGTRLLKGHTWSNVLLIPKIYEVVGMVMLGYSDKNGERVHHGKRVERGDASEYIICQE